MSEARVRHLIFSIEIDLRNGTRLYKSSEVGPNEIQLGWLRSQEYGSLLVAGCWDRPRALIAFCAGCLLEDSRMTNFERGG